MQHLIIKLNIVIARRSKCIIKQNAAFKNKTEQSDRSL